MFDDYVKDLLVRDVLRGTIPERPRPLPATQLPLCTYCDHSHLEHAEDRALETMPCRHPLCGCLNFRDPSVMENEESEGN